jgi:transposase-like protein
MARKSGVFSRSKIGRKKMRELLRYFAEDLSASQACRLSGLSALTVNRYYRRFRDLMAVDCARLGEWSGAIEIDESYFGAKRVRGRRGRGAGGKIIVFGIYKRNGEVRAEIVADCSKAALQAVLRRYVGKDSVIHSDGFGAYDGLIGLGYKDHRRIRHHAGEFAKGKNHINGIEGFWGFCKHRLAKFKGIRASAFALHLKECEFRFNHRKNLHAKMKEICGF